MKEFLKKYWTHIMSLGFLSYTTILFYLFDSNSIKYNGQTIAVIFGILIFFVIGVWVEIIYGIVHAIKHKEIKNNALCAVLSYFFNVVYVPCYCLKYVSKDENYKKKNTIYLIVSILLYIALIISMIRFSINSTMYETYNTNDNMASFKVPYDYYKTNIGEYDLYFKNNYSNIGVFIYDGYDFTDDEILSYQENQIVNSRENMILIDSNVDTLNNKIIKTHTYEGINDGDANIYNFSVISFKEKPNYIIYIIESTLKEDYSSNKKELHQILKDINLNK